MSTARGIDALITGDNLRADVAAEFYIKVQKIKEHILAAATSLGERSVDAESVKHLVNQKLVSALRTVAATRPLHELHTKRDEFAQAVQIIVEKDLAHNGLTLESVTISRLDQTLPNAMRGEDNVFDAQARAPSPRSAAPTRRTQPDRARRTMRAPRTWLMTNSSSSRMSPVPQR
ncbi:MAG: flotillin family protein [Thermomicrobiales bacterium]